MAVTLDFDLYRNPVSGVLESGYNPSHESMTISGAVGHGSDLTINANGFAFDGQIASAPAIWEDFSTATAGQLVYDYDSNWVKYAGAGAVITDRNPRYAGHLSAYNGTDRGEFLTNNKLFTGNRKIYVSYWLRTDNADIGVGAVSGGDYAVIKWARLGSVDGGGGIYNGRGMHSVSNQQPQGPDSPYSLYRTSSGSEVNLGYISIPWNQWCRLEMQIYMSSAGVVDGFYNVYSGNGQSKLSGSIMQRESGDTHTIGSFLMGLELANYSRRLSYYVGVVAPSSDYSVTHLGTTYTISSGISPTESSIVTALANEVNYDPESLITAHVSPTSKINIRLKSTGFSPAQSDFSFSANFTRHIFGLQNSDILVQQGSFARIVIGDASTWSGCSEATKEPQPYTSWSAGSVTIKQNIAAISGAKWLYYIQDNNTPKFTDGVPLI